MGAAAPHAIFGSFLSFGQFALGGLEMSFAGGHGTIAGLADFGQSQGSVATGFVLADMTDPQRRTSTANDYGYKQLAYEPFLGGGLLTALSVPLITQFGLLPFTVVSIVLTGLLALWGIRRRTA